MQLASGLAGAQGQGSSWPQQSCPSLEAAVPLLEPERRDAEPSPAGGLLWAPTCTLLWQVALLEPSRTLEFKCPYLLCPNSGQNGTSWVQPAGVTWDRLSLRRSPASPLRPALPVTGGCLPSSRWGQEPWRGSQGHVHHGPRSEGLGQAHSQEKPELLVEAPERNEPSVFPPGSWEEQASSDERSPGKSGMSEGLGQERLHRSFLLLMLRPLLPEMRRLFS